MKKILIFFSLFLVVSIGSGFAADDLLLAKIGQDKIMMSDFKRVTGYYDKEKQEALQKNPEYSAVILQRLVQGKVISDIAKKNNFDKQEDIKEQIKLLVNDFIATQYLKEVVSKINVTEDDMRLYYKVHKDKFETPEMSRVSHILLKADKNTDKETRQKTLKRADEILKKIKDGEDFAKLASEYSEDDASKINGGKIGLLPKGKLMPELDKIAFGLKPGETSGVIETTYGYHILKVYERKDPGIQPYEEVKDKVRKMVVDEFKKSRVDEFTEKAMKDAGVEFNLEAFLPKK